jgi:hypothetical protein
MRVSRRVAALVWVGRQMQEYCLTKRGGSLRLRLNDTSTNQMGM